MLELRKKADSHINNANSMIRNGRHRDAVNESKKALNYINTYEYVNKVDNVKKTFREKNPSGYTGICHRALSRNNLFIYSYSGRTGAQIH